MRLTSPVARFGGLLSLLLTLAGVLAVVGVPSPAELARALGTTAVPAPVLAVAGFAVLVLGLVPRTLLAAAAGLVFGPLAGAGYIILGATLGALVAFGIGRWLGREFVAVQTRASRLDGWLASRGVAAVVTVRVLPVAPFGLVSYAFGASGVRLGAYLVGTVVGMLPATAVYVNLGAASTRPGSVGFWIAVSAAVLLWLTTTSVIALLERRRARSSRNMGATSGY
ncbi:MAG TPA: VTT domain-containing protein [Micromonosporaceae bacterium]